MTSSGLALNIAKPCLRAGGSAVASCLPRKLVTDNKQHVSSDFLKPKFGASQENSTVARFLDERRTPCGSSSGLRTDPEDLKGVSFSDLRYSIAIPTLEAARNQATLELLGLEGLDLSAVQIMLVDHAAALAAVPVVSLAPVSLSSDVFDLEKFEEPRQCSKSTSSEPSQSGKTQKRRQRAAKLSKASHLESLDDLQGRLKKYRTMAVVADMRHQQQLVMRAWASLSARSRRDAAQRQQLRVQRRMHAMRAVQAHLDHEQQLALRSWSAIVADLRKTRAHEQQLVALHDSSLARPQYATYSHAPIAGDCPSPPGFTSPPPGLWDVSHTGLAGIENNAQPRIPKQASNSCSACLNNWGCLEHCVYSTRLFLAQRESGMKVLCGPPGLELEPEEGQVKFGSLDSQIRVEKVTLTRQRQRSQRQLKHTRG